MIPTHSATPAKVSDRELAARICNAVERLNVLLIDAAVAGLHVTIDSFDTSRMGLIEGNRTYTAVVERRVSL